MFLELMMGLMNQKSKLIEINNMKTLLVKEVVEKIDSLVEDDVLSGFATINCIDDEYDFYDLGEFVSYLKEQLTDNGNDMKVTELPSSVQEWIEDFNKVDWNNLFVF